MNPDHPLNSSMDQEALAWATRLDGGLTAVDEAQLRSWLDENPVHEWRLAHFRQFYAQLHGAVPVLQAQGRIAGGPAASRRRFGAARQWAIGFAAAAALLVAGIWLANRPAEFATVAAQRQKVTLADGTQADLNARTVLTVQLHGVDRRVHLERGEAYFEVAKNPARPFYVETPAGTVRVTGTKFNVRADSAGSLEVTVLEGSVAVNAGTASRQEFHLSPNDQVVVEGGLAAERGLSALAAAEVIAWRDGKVTFDDTPLATAVARFAAYHGRTLTVAPEAGGLLLGGRYTLDDLDQFLVSLEKTMPVRVLRGENGAVRLVAADKPLAP